MMITWKEAVMIYFKVYTIIGFGILMLVFVSSFIL